MDTPVARDARGPRLPTSRRRPSPSPAAPAHPGNFAAPGSIRCRLAASRAPRLRIRGRPVGCFGTIRPTLVTSNKCPALPTRWSPRATEAGEDIWTTMSTEPMSIPSSREDVATSARISPRFSAYSTESRRSLERLPWWLCASSDGAISFSRPATFSACVRSFTKTRLDSRSATRSRTVCAMDGHAVFPGIARKSVTGETTRISMSFRPPASTIVTGRGTRLRFRLPFFSSESVASTWPPRNRAASSSGFAVADSPIR